MTEAGPVLSMCLAFAKEPFEVKSGACGTVVRNAEMKIIDPQTGVSFPRNHPGEICIRGSQIMKGKSQPHPIFLLLAFLFSSLSNSILTQMVKTIIFSTRSKNHIYFAWSMNGRELVLL